MARYWEPFSWGKVVIMKLTTGFHLVPRLRIYPIGTFINILLTQGQLFVLIYKLSWKLHYCFISCSPQNEMMQGWGISKLYRL